MRRRRRGSGGRELVGVGGGGQREDTEERMRHQCRNLQRPTVESLGCHLQAQRSRCTLQRFSATRRGSGPWPRYLEDEMCPDDATISILAQIRRPPFAQGVSPALSLLG